MSAPRRLPPEALSQFDQWAAGVFDRSSLGMLRVSREKIVVAGNRTAAEMCGLTSLEGWSIKELLVDQSGLDAMQQEAAHRRQGLSTEYDVNVVHFPDRRPVPVRVCGMPVIGSNGEVLGSLAIIRSLEMDHRIQKFEDAILRAQGVDEIFQAVCDHTRPLLNFDFASFSIYSKTGKHARMLRSYDPNNDIQTQKRWYPISTGMAAWVQQLDIQSIGVEEFLNRFPELRSEPSVRMMLAGGYVRILRCPVVREGRVIASFSCLSRDANAFGEDAINIVKALPIAKAFLMAMHSLEEAELLFRFNLIRDMFICRTPESIAEVAVKALARQYHWKSVEIYALDQANQRVRLVKQEAAPEYQLEEGFSQPMGKGVVGVVCQNDRDVLIDDITTNPEFRHTVVRLGRATRSELCMPIRVNGRVAAVINIEDQMENAFSKEEQENLRSLLDEIGGLFSAVWDKALIASTFDLTPSLVFIADLAGNIIQYNAAAASALGFSGAELAGTPLKNYFERPETAGSLFKASQIHGLETGLRRKDGGVLPALVGSRELDGFDAWLITARDLTHQKRVAELEGLRHVYREIAAQMKMPLSLAYSWLQRLQRKTGALPEGTADVLQKVLAQLKKVDLTYERLAWYGRDTGEPEQGGLLLNAGDLLKRTLANFPEDLLSVSGLERKDFYLRGDAFEIGFSVESALSYLMRFLPAEERVKVAVSSAAGRLIVEMAGPFPERPDSSGFAAPPEEICQATHEMALGAEIISKFMEHHHGSFRQEKMAGSLRFELDFPIAPVEV